MSAVLQKKQPPKCKDLGSFTIPCIIGNTKFEKAMFDLDVLINVMPHSINVALNFGLLRETDIVIQLADCSNV